MKKAWIRLAASVVLSALLVVGISASGILTNGHRTDGLFYQASGIRPDAELLTVNGETIDAEEYLYWLAYDCEYLAYNVQDLDFDAELSEGMTYGAYAKQDALETVKLYAVVRQWAKRGNVTLSDADREALENQRQQYITYYGSQEAYSKQIQGMGVSEAMFDAISRGYYLYAGVRQAFCTPGSALYPAQENIDALARQKGYATSLLLYWPLDGQDDDNTRLAAESFAQQLRDAQDVTAAYLDLAGQLGMEDVTEAGVTASAGDMGETLAAAVSALEPGQVSDVIDTGSALYVAVGKELDQSAVVNALFETQIKAAVADAKVEYNTRLFNKLDPGAFYTRLQEARSALS